LICALGTFAAQTLLQTEEKISLLRGKFHHYQGIPLMPTYHPAFLLRNSNYKRDVWEDMKKIKREYEQL
jgi:DNA polymerase